MTNRPKAIGTACMICSGPIPQLDGRTWRRKTCSDECKAAYRRQQWAERPKSPKPRPSLHTRFWSFTIPGRRGLHSNADVLAAAHGVTRQCIQQVAQGHYRKAISA